MEIEWVKEDVVTNIRRGAYSSQLPILEKMVIELKKHPGAWAKFPEPITSQPVLHRWKKIFPGLEFRSTGGNSLKADDPKKKQWTAYVRYVNND
jgi:hypothetical protein